MSGHFPLLYEKNFVRNRILTERYLHQNSSTELYVFNVLALQINCVRIDSFSFFYSCFDDKNIFFKLKVLASISDFGQRLFDYEFVRLSISFMTKFVFFRHLVTLHDYASVHIALKREGVMANARERKRSPNNRTKCNDVLTVQITFYA